MTIFESCRLIFWVVLGMENDCEFGGGEVPEQSVFLAAFYGAILKH